MITAQKKYSSRDDGVPTLETEDVTSDPFKDTDRDSWYLNEPAPCEDGCSNYDLCKSKKVLCGDFYAYVSKVSQTGGTVRHLKGREPTRRFWDMLYNVCDRDYIRDGEVRECRWRLKNVMGKYLCPRHDLGMVE